MIIHIGFTSPHSCSRATHPDVCIACLAPVRLAVLCTIGNALLGTETQGGETQPFSSASSHETHRRFETKRIRPPGQRMRLSARLWNAGHGLLPHLVALLLVTSRPFQCRFLILSASQSYQKSRRLKAKSPLPLPKSESLFLARSLNTTSFEFEKDYIQNAHNLHHDEQRLQRQTDRHDEASQTFTLTAGSSAPPGDKSLEGDEGLVRYVLGPREGE